MSIDLKQDVINAVRKGNCPEYRQNSHACLGCPHAITVLERLGCIIRYDCGNTKYDKKTYIVKPKKIKRRPKFQYSGDGKQK